MRESTGRLQLCPVKKPLHFFKILLPAYLRKLPIPRRFVQKFGEELPIIVHLKGPGDRMWHVELEEIDGIIYFLKGWKDFVEGFSLQVGYLLVFGYEGDSHFRVLIFDRSACEKEYSFGHDYNEESCSNNGACAPEKESDTSIEIVDVSKSKVENVDLNLTKRRHKYTPQVLRSSIRLQSISRRMDLDLGNKSEDCKIKAMREVPKSRSHESKFKKSGGSEGSQEVDWLNHLPSMQQHVDSKLKSNAIELMESFHENLLHCSRERSPSQKALMKLDCQTIESSIPSSGEIFSVNGENQESVPDSLSSEDFGYSLKHKKNKKHVKRMIHRTLLSGSRELKAMEVQRELAEAINFKSDRPFFIVSMKLSNLHLYTCPRLYIPSTFVKEHFFAVPGHIFLEDSNGRAWRMRCLRTKCGYMFLTSGWSAFLLDNNLERGDVCAFELLNRQNTVLRVTIYPKADMLPLNQLSCKRSSKKNRRK